jgi:acetoacetyl-CoA synthetase
MEFDKAPRKLWEHADPKSTAMWAFMQAANAKYGLKMQVSPWPASNQTL